MQGNLNDFIAWKIRMFIGPKHHSFILLFKFFLNFLRARRAACILSQLVPKLFLVVGGQPLREVSIGIIAFYDLTIIAIPITCFNMEKARTLNIPFGFFFFSCYLSIALG